MASRLLAEVLDELIVVREIGAVTLDAGGEPDQCHDVLVGLGVFHDEGLRDVAGLHVVDLLGYLLGELRHLEAGGVVVVRVHVGVDHHAAVVAGVLVVGEHGYGLLKGYFLVDEVGAERVEAQHGVGEVFLGHARTQQYVAHVDTVAALLDELDYVVAILGLDNLRHLFGVVEVEGYGCKLGHVGRAAGKAEFAASGRRAGVFAIEDGEGRKIALTLVDAVGVVAQTGLDIIDFLARNGRGCGEYLHLHLAGHVGDGVFGHLVEIAAHV